MMGLEPGRRDVEMLQAMPGCAPCSKDGNRTSHVGEGKEGGEPAEPAVRQSGWTERSCQWHVWARSDTEVSGLRRCR